MSFYMDKKDYKGWHFSALGIYRDSVESLLSYIKKENIQEPVFLEISGIEFEVDKNASVDENIRKYQKLDDERAKKVGEELRKKDEEYREWLNTPDGKELIEQGEKDKKFVNSIIFSEYSQALEAIKSIKANEKSEYYQKLMLILAKSHKINFTNEKVTEIVNVLKDQGVTKHAYTHVPYAKLAERQDNDFAEGILTNILDDSYALNIVGEQFVPHLLTWICTQRGLTKDETEKFINAKDDRKKYKYENIVSEYDYNIAKAVQSLEELMEKPPKYLSESEMQ